MKVKIAYVNGSTSEHLFRTMSEAREFCRRGISYSARVQRVELHGDGSVFSIWDASWTEESKYAGLYR